MHRTSLFRSLVGVNPKRADLIAGIAAALVTAGVLGLWFSSTRTFSITAVAVLAFLFPWLVVPILIGSVAAFYVFRIRR